jgi:hypothetical protein
MAISKRCPSQGAGSQEAMLAWQLLEGAEEDLLLLGTAHRIWRPLLE